ncbi:hypothetical protein [Streptococcus equinus]|uniref:hypothetical protein n=1 Tax=Streptococcus equinus TaxID=1335 RepID=UPI0005F7A2C1|nr:hypothetical protein [Streptococcus equinus]
MIINQKVARICLQGARGYCERVAGGCENWADGIIEDKKYFSGMHPLSCSSLLEEIEMAKAK